MDPAARPPNGEQQRADELAIAGAKRLLRKAVGFRRDSRSPEQRRDDDTQRLAVLAGALGDQMPQRVAAYLSSGSEPGTLQLVAWLAARDVRVLLPVLTDGGRERLPEPAWGVYTGPDALQVGLADIVQPTGPAFGNEVLNGAQLIICPGMAANVRGQRLGRGGGWYDRSLQQKTKATPVWVLLNEDEVFEAIPTDHWDLGVDAIVTPTRYIRCQP